MAGQAPALGSPARALRGCDHSATLSRHTPSIPSLTVSALVPLCASRYIVKNASSVPRSASYGYLPTTARRCSP